MPKIYCKNDACGYIGAPIRLKELHEIDYSLPLICSHCQRTNRFEVEDVQFGDDLYKYTCQYCDDYMIINKPPNKTKRALENPENAISIHDPKAEINEPDVDTQQTLSSYT